MYIVVLFEIQSDYNVPYSLLTRGEYGLAREISSQRGKFFTGNKFGEMDKIYAIWICPIAEGMEGHVVAFYRTPFLLMGALDKTNYMKDSYQRSNLILCKVPSGITDPECLLFLDVLLGASRSFEEKCRILEEKFHLPMMIDVTEGMRDMCNLSDQFEVKAREKLEEAWQEAEKEKKKALEEAEKEKKKALEEAEEEKKKALLEQATKAEEKEKALLERATKAEEEKKALLEQLKSAFLNKWMSLDGYRSTLAAMGMRLTEQMEVVPM